MGDKDRLIELHEEAEKEWSAYFDNSWVKGENRSKSYKEFIADYLLANGLIVQKQGEWISAPIKDIGYDSKTIPTCTSCGYQSFITYTYCPECGAKLKELGE